MIDSVSETPLGFDLGALDCGKSSDRRAVKEYFGQNCNLHHFVSNVSSKILIYQFSLVYCSALAMKLILVTR